MKLQEGSSQETIAKNIRRLEESGQRYDQALAIALNNAAKSNKDVKYVGKAFYGSRLSDNMTKTPEGYLVCQNVPIARIGTQEYLGQELGLEGDYYDRVIEVHRREEDVFHQDAMSSFEGKPVTNEHPGSDVRIDNYPSYAKGHAQNIRRGEGDYVNNVVADLVICDPTLISEIENGKREVSCGYDCVYVVDDSDNVYQTQIRGNHVAIVKAGRAGSEVSIKDTKPSKPMKVERRDRNMSAEDKKKSIFARMLKVFATDATPEDVQDALEAYGLSGSSTKDGDPEPNKDGGESVKENKQGDATNVDTGATKVPDEGTTATGAADSMVEKLLATLESMKADIAELKAANKPKDEEDPLAKLEKELGGDEATEGDVTSPAEEIDEELSLEDEEVVDEEGPIAPESSLPKNPIPGADKKALLGMIREFKPVIAQIKDAKQRKQVSDAFAKSLRQQLGTKSTQKGSYGAIMDAKRQAATKRTKDSQEQSYDEYQLGREIAQTRNPHYKKQDK